MFRFPGQVAITLIIACVSAGTVCAQAYPSKTVRIVVPFAAGGGTDVIARYLAAGLTESLKNQVIVDNRAGANAIVGTELVARAPADGYTLLFVSSPHSVNPSMYAKLPYDTLRDFAPVSLIALSPYFLVVHPSLPARSVKELLALARANPGKLSYASAGVGTTFHFCAEMFKDETKTFILHVPYRGGGPALVDTLSGQVDMSFPTLSAALPHVKAGTLRALAVTSATRSKLLPDVPTMQEAGVKGFQFTQWLALLAPAGTPPPVVARLNGALNAVLGSKEMAEKFQQQGFDPFTTTPEEARKFLAGEVQRYARLIKARGITAQ